MKWPTAAEALFSLKSFAAAMLALYLAMRLGLPRPFWAPLAAYVVSQPLSGAVRSKALYRFLGTLLGAAFCVIAVPRLVNYSLLLTLAMALWIGVCLYISVLDRTPRSYIFMLAGYTPCLIGFPALVDTSAFSHATMFDTALARVEEITLGVACATLVHSLVLPQSVGPVILGRMDKALADAQAWLGHALLGSSPAQNAVDHRKLAQDVSDLRLMATHLPFDTSNLRWTASAIRVLQDRLASLIPYMTAVEDRIRLLRGAGQLEPKWQALLADVAGWARQGKDGSPESATALRRRIDAVAPAAAIESSWSEVIEINLAAHLNRLVDAFESCFDLRRRIDLGLRENTPVDPGRLSRVPTRELHADRGLAMMSAFATFMAVCGSSLFWVVSGWPTGFAAPMIAGMFCSFFSTLDDPVPALKTTLVFTVLSSFIAGAYVLLLLPSAHSFEMLMLVLAPFMLAGGIYLGRPSTTLRAVPLCFTTLATLTMFDMEAADMTSFINSQISQAIGLGMSVLFTGLFRSVSAEWTAHRLLRAGWEEIARLAQAARPPSPVAVTVRMVDRVGQLTPRLAATGENRERVSGMALEDIRVGVNVAHLLRAQKHLLRNAVTVQPLLRQLADHFRRRTNHVRRDDPELLRDIDHALGGVCGAPAFPQRNHAIAALAGIRRDLFPDAAPYMPHPQPQHQSRQPVHQPA